MDNKRKRKQKNGSKTMNVFTGGCYTKVKHSTLERAQQEAERLTQKFGRKMNAYICRFCFQYHTGREKSHFQNNLQQGSK